MLDERFRDISLEVEKVCLPDSLGRVISSKVSAEENVPAFRRSTVDGYAVKSDSLPQDWREWFVNDNDGTNEGIIHISKPFFAAQFHPEASPGPDDCEFIFDMFVRALK